MNYAIRLAYDGTRYNGWQRQGNTDRTIQGKLEAVLAAPASLDRLARQAYACGKKHHDKAQMQSMLTADIENIVRNERA